MTRSAKENSKAVGARKKSRKNKNTIESNAKSEDMEVEHENRKQKRESSFGGEIRRSAEKSDALPEDLLRYPS